MTIDSILAQIDAEIAKLTQVRSLLASTGKVAATVTERITKKATTAAKSELVVKTGKTKKRRKLSAEARKRIAEAQRKRWAALKSKA
jgi:hypothetical protein